MVKVTIECDGTEPIVLTGEYAWGTVSTKVDDGIASNAYLLGKTSVRPRRIARICISWTSW